MPGEGRVALSLLSVETSAGLAQALVDLPRRSATAVLVVGHGAGGETDAPDLLVLTKAAVAAGLAVVRVRQPYRVAGRRAPAPAPQLDAAWAQTVDAVARGAAPFQAQARRLRGRPLVVCGRSSGARVACRTATACGAAGVVALAFPLHPPGKPEKSRADELRVSVPLLVVQGDRDAFGRPAEFPPKINLIEVPGADHALKAASFGPAADRIVDWVTALVG